MRLVQPIGSLLALLVAELVSISIWLDTATLEGHGALTRLAAHWGPGALRFLIVFAVMLLMLGQSRMRTQISSFSVSGDHRGVAWPLFTAHLGLTLLFAGLSSVLFGSRVPAPLDTTLAALWIVTGVASGSVAALAFMPAVFWAQMFRAMRPALIFAFVLSLGVYAFGWFASTFWPLLSRGTLAIAYAMLHPVAPAIHADVSTLTIGTPTFRIEIGPECSGYEGLGLMLVFTAAWLWFHSAEWRFPHALVLVPIGLVAIWLANCVRIAALVLIGTAGAPRIAVGGFHSQAGWLAFNVIAVGICLVARRTPWMTRTVVDSGAASFRESNPTAAYLLPFLAIVAAAMVAQLGSDGFEWLYPIRVVASAAALVYFWRNYQTLDWRFGWISVASGCAVFAVWVVLERFVGSKTPVGAPLVLSQAPETVRAIWLAFRVIGAVIMVPIAEELAFRGFLLRRFVSADFESVDWRSVSWTAIVLSSIVFGVLHNGRWVAGTVAGIIYAVAVLRRGSIGDAVVAHATSNGLIAAWVLLGGSWQLW